MISSCPVLQGFGNHIDKDHNMWDYVYYSFYLDSIDTITTMQLTHTSSTCIVYRIAATVITKSRLL